ncbi:hypothetical protein [Pedobacter sp. MR2016-24]|uniref:hypothetical protein n=1 Tax=Pedobacter sp. MR2016-24 TaxID=2994466 RepID=UPI002246929B|nr:hypothetical protein [Pedobacter sp. MR2016-24]MCX2486686.1 hypothetical protein [Pedobacter sp. MR2016-24]
MQGINKSKHVHLLKALNQLEEIVSDGDRSYNQLLQVREYRNELDLMYANYQKMLINLEQHIIAYDELHKKVKIQYLGRKLKELKKTAHKEDITFASLLSKTIRSFGT